MIIIFLHRISQIWWIRYMNVTLTYGWLLFVKNRPYIYLVKNIGLELFNWVKKRFKTLILLLVLVPVQNDIVSGFQLQPISAYNISYQVRFCWCCFGLTSLLRSLLTWLIYLQICFIVEFKFCRNNLKQKINKKHVML